MSVGTAFAMIFLFASAAMCGAQDEGKGSMLKITSPEFSPGAAIPRDFTADGKDVSPAVGWENAPAGTRYFALVCDDPDAPGGTWVHWVIYNIPGTAKGLPRGLPAQATLKDGSAQGRNDFGKIGYGGPSPPRGKPHRYFFTLYALGEKVALASGATKKDLLKAIEGHVLAKADMLGTYAR